MYLSNSDRQWIACNMPDSDILTAHAGLCQYKRQSDIVPGLVSMLDYAWSVTKESSGTDGVFLKCQKQINNTEYFYKLSSFSTDKGFYGHECALELVAQRVIDWCGIEHAVSRLIPARVCIEGMYFNTHVICSKDYRKPGEHRISLKQYCELQGHTKDRAEFLLSGEFAQFFIEAFVVDFILLNRDRHGRNLEVLVGPDGVRMAPLFDHGCCLTQRLFDSWRERDETYYLYDGLVSNYVGYHTLKKNLEKYCPGRFNLPHNYLPDDLLAGLETVLGRGALFIPIKYVKSEVRVCFGSSHYIPQVLLSLQNSRMIGTKMNII